MVRLHICLLFMLSVISCTHDTMKDKQANTDSLVDNKNEQVKNILFFGNSLTAGYGLEDPGSESFPALIQVKLDSLGLGYKAVNAGLSGETTAGGKGRIGSLLKNKMDIFVLELGANDGLRGVPVSQTEENLQSIIDTVKLRYPEAKLVLLGMQVPPDMGGKYARDFNAVFPRIAAKNDMLLVPSLLNKVAGIPHLNLRDGVHPTANGQKILAENVWDELKTIL